MDRRNLVSFLIVVLLWVVSGMFLGPVVYGVAVITWFLWLRSDRYIELFIGFLIVLVLSDSLEDNLRFAGTLKTFYILFLGLAVLLKRRVTGIFPKVLIPYAPYLFIAFLCLLWSPALVAGLQKTVSYGLLFFLGPSIAHFLYTERLDFFKIMNYFTGFILVLSFLVFLLLPEVGTSHGGRLRGIFGNPNGLGLFIIVTFLFYQFTMWQDKAILSRFERISLLVLFGAATVLTGSRNALLSILLFYVFEFTFRNFKYLGIVVSVFIIVGLNFLLANAIEIIRALSLEEFFRLETLVEGSGRLIAWQFAWQKIQDSFYLGRGIGFDEFLMRSNAMYLSKLGHEGGVHNTYLIIWLNTGLVGVVAFFGALFYLFSKASARTLFAFPFLFTVLFCISFEPWLAASLNPYTIVFLTILTGLFIAPESLAINKIEMEEDE